MDPFEEPDDEFVDPADSEIDALSLLRDDHLQVAALFEQFESAALAVQDDRRRALAERACELLTVHAQIEEEIFYPAVRAVIEEQELLDDAEVEHAVAKELIEQIQTMDVDEALYDAKVRVLAEYVRHHIQAEEDELFGLVELADLDLDELGEELAARKQELLGAGFELAG
jgi:hemerythrin superfamily protein